MEEYNDYQFWGFVSTRILWWVSVLHCRCLEKVIVVHRKEKRLQFPLHLLHDRQMQVEDFVFYYG